MLSNALGHPVLDKTWLTGKYDFTLDYAINLSGLQLPPPPPVRWDRAQRPIPPAARGRISRQPCSSNSG
jgi:uncharacterized protein (TIGR03435 family)